jgi:hypothetical protein
MTPRATQDLELDLRAGEGNFATHALTARVLDGRPRRYIAACASAIGAVASAVAAIYALVFLYHQEEIARTQLQATYLSNLFTKQVDSLASLQATLSEFFEMLFHDQMLDMIDNETTHNADDITKYYNHLKERYPTYDKMIYTISAKTAAVYLVVPKSLGKVVEIPLAAFKKITKTMREFIEGEPTKETFDRFGKDMREKLDTLGQWLDIYVDCLRNILAGGQPITVGNVTPCTRL